MSVECVFPVLGREVPRDHGFALFGALCRAIPKLHEPEFPAAVGPISGEPTGTGRLRLPEGSQLRVRLPAEAVATLLPLAGRALDLDGCRVRLGVPTLYALTPAASLFARIVITKNGEEPSRFLGEVTRQLRELGLSSVEPQIPLIASGPHVGKPTRRVMRIHAKKLVGWALMVEGLSAEESLLLQERGLGGRRKMGAGWFVPSQPQFPKETL